MSAIFLGLFLLTSHVGEELADHAVTVQAAVSIKATRHKIKYEVANVSTSKPVLRSQD